MILDFLLALFESAFTMVLGVLPSHTLGFTDHLSLFASNLTALNYFLPIQETVSVVLGVLVLFPMLAGVNFALWCVMALRGGSSRG